MKLLLLLLAAALCFALHHVHADSLDMGREVRSYTSDDMEIVDHLDMSSSSDSDDLPTKQQHQSTHYYSSQHDNENSENNEHENSEHSMMETEGSSDQQHEESDDTGMHFRMEDELADSSSTEEDGLIDVESFLESSSQATSSVAEFQHENDEIDTNVLRQMALEIHDAAQAHLDEDGDVMLIESDSFSDSEHETDAEMELGDSETPEEEQDRKDREADAKEKAEEAKEKAAGDAPEGEKKPKETVAASSSDSSKPKKSTEDSDSKKSSPSSSSSSSEHHDDEHHEAEHHDEEHHDSDDHHDKETITLPSSSDLSSAHSTLHSAQDHTQSLLSTLSEMGHVLQDKDDTIASLVANTTYLTVSLGKVANRLDQQREYIRVLRQKLLQANSLIRKLRNHAAETEETSSSIRSQLDSVEQRLKKQDETSELLKEWLKENGDDSGSEGGNSAAPQYEDDLAVVGERPTGANIVRGRRHSRRQRTRRGNGQRHGVGVGLHEYGRFVPVEGTQTLADVHGNVVPFLSAQEQQRYYTGGQQPQQQVYTQPAYGPDGIPTIVVERYDDGQ